MKRLAVAFLTILAACGTPGVEVVPQPGDFAFLEVDVEPLQTGDQQPLYALVGTPVSRANPKFIALKAFHDYPVIADPAMQSSPHGRFPGTSGVAAGPQRGTRSRSRG